LPPQATPEVSDAEIALAREKERKALEDLALERKQAEDKKKELEAKKKEKLKAQRDTETRKKLREDQLKRMAGLANASGAPTASGTALKSAGPSANYAGRIVARVKPNIVFTEEIKGNPRAEVEVRTAPDGTIVGSKLVKSSGSKSWDEAVLRAIEKTEVLPRNEDGLVPSPMTIGFRPRD
jgi:colicin import membrane protein